MWDQFPHCEQHLIFLFSFLLFRSGNSGESQWWGDQFLFQLKDMLAETCKARQIPDCEFFINKRDYPHLKFHCEVNEKRKQKEREMGKEKEKEGDSSQDHSGKPKAGNGVTLTKYLSHLSLFLKGTSAL
jgi:hypothetical protein